MYCNKHEGIGDTPAKINFSIEEYKRTVEAIRKISCPECRKEFLTNPRFRDMTVEQFLEL